MHPCERLWHLNFFRGVRLRQIPNVLLRGMGKSVNMPTIGMPLQSVLSVQIKHPSRSDFAADAHQQLSEGSDLE